ncbi:WD40 repeat-like protein [Sistotremastrum suecicum HHB10207 ss-3]|uniref:WD40 repeat-like protein n=1 Tax=Sistotremastrum suecicum HHB10207 ss-3 TaxID=1314776 RepID=A0A166HVZ3_9AGAM|nr:WD40 repeat-like protein [Sistotremastrum suecicum HHB10207 ss-3]
MSLQPRKKRKVAFEAPSKASKGKAPEKSKRSSAVAFDVPSPKQKVKAAATTAKKPVESVPSSKFKIVAGSYEKILIGLEGSFPDPSSSIPELKPVFIFPAHVSSVRAIATSPEGGKWLATGSTDEIIKVWDLRRRKEVGGLMHHEGSITHLVFPDRSHLLSASEDGTISVFRVRDWVLLRSLKGHKGRVNNIAVHPSRKVALSVGKDRTIRMWDLVRGKGVASVKLGKEGEIIRWSKNGNQFAVQSHSTIDLYSTDMALLHTITHPSRLHDLRFHILSEDREILLVAAEVKKVTAYALPSDTKQPPTIVAEFVGHMNRSVFDDKTQPYLPTDCHLSVKSIDTLEVALPTKKTMTLLASASSDGLINIYDISSIPSESGSTPSIERIAHYDTKGSRLICVALADGAVSTSTPISGKKRAADEDDDEESDEEVLAKLPSEDEAHGSGEEGDEDEDDEE